LHGAGLGNSFYLRPDTFLVELKTEHGYQSLVFSNYASQHEFAYFASNVLPFASSSGIYLPENYIHSLMRNLTLNFVHQCKSFNTFPQQWYVQRVSDVIQRRNHQRHHHGNVNVNGGHLRTVDSTDDAMITLLAHHPNSKHHHRNASNSFVYFNSRDFPKCPFVFYERSDSRLSPFNQSRCFVLPCTDGTPSPVPQLSVVEREVWVQCDMIFQQIDYRMWGPNCNCTRLKTALLTSWDFGLRQD
jgi:hypothetical protein